MAANAARNEQPGRDMGFEEAEIRRKMLEISDWLHAQAAPLEPASRVEPPARPPQPRLQEPRLQAVAMAPPAPANTQPDAGSLNGIIQGRLAARRERIEAERMETVRKAEDGGSLREVMGRFPGPFSRQQSQSDGNAGTFRPGENPGPLRSAVAEIVERQRKLDEPVRPASDIGEMRQHRLDEPARPVSDINETLERAFQKLAEQFEQRAARTFDSLEVSLAEVTRLITESPLPAQAAESAVLNLVQPQLQAMESQTNVRIDTIAREVANLRSDAGESERRTRDMLDTVRQSLEHVAARLPDRATPAPIAVQPAESPSARARAAAQRALEERAQDERTGRPEPHATQTSGAERRQYIAAARRSNQTPEPATRKRPQTSRNAAVRSMKRTLLAGAAAAALLVGIYAGSSRFLDGMFADTQLAAVPDAQIDTGAEPVPAAPTPAAAEPRTASATPAETAPSHAPVATSSLLDPTITGSIPRAQHATPAPLPVEIGGPRLRTRAVAGDANAQYEVAIRFAEGRGVARDMDKASEWLERAADQGLAPAQYRLAHLLEKGNGVPKDVQTARGLYEQAATAGNVQAMHNLGVLYAEGGFGQPDVAVASVWFRKAAEHGVRDSQYNLGILYARGLSVPQDLAESWRWFALAAKQGDKDAASKRDQIGAKLDPANLQAMEVAADTWQPKAAPVEANEVTPPPQGWDTPAAT